MATVVENADDFNRLLSDANTPVVAAFVASWDKGSKKMNAPFQNLAGEMIHAAVSFP